MKKCSKCNHKKELSNFHKDSSTASGYKSACKVCTKKSTKDYASKRKEYIQQYSKEYYQRNKTKRKAYSKKYRQINQSYYRAKKAEYRATKKQATCQWANFQYIKDLYSNVAEANKVFSMIGVKFHVDHIVPLTNDKVCGLHNEYNLQILTAEKNLSKSNKYDPINTDIGV
jgi:hypothetical protein